MVVSSGNKIHFNMEYTLHKSLIYILNSFGPRIEPCGIPHLTVFFMNLCHLSVHIMIVA